MAVLLDKKNIGISGGSSNSKIAEALAQLSPDQQGALQLATTVNELKSEVDTMFVPTTDTKEYPEF